MLALSLSVVTICDIIRHSNRPKFGSAAAQRRTANGPNLPACIAFSSSLRFIPNLRRCNGADVPRSFSSNASFLDHLRPFYDVVLDKLFEFVRRAGHDL